MLIKRVKLLLSMAVICIGAILIAPMASANEYTAPTWAEPINSYPFDVSSYRAECISLANSQPDNDYTVDDCYTLVFQINPTYYQVRFLFHSSLDPMNFKIIKQSTSNAFAVEDDGSTYLGYGYSVDIINNVAEWSSVYNAFDTNFTNDGIDYKQILVNPTWENDTRKSLALFTNFRGNIEYAVVSDYTYPDRIFQPVNPLIYDGGSSVIDTTEQTYSNVLLQEYLHENHITAETTGYIITSNNTVMQVPVSYTYPDNYDGAIWIKQTQYTPYLDMFEVVCDPEFIDDYRGARAAVLYDLDVTTLNFYAVTHRDIVETGDSSTQFSVYVNDSLNGSQNLENNIGYYSFAGTTYYGTHYSVEHNSNDTETVYAIWYFNPHPFASIPKLQPIFVGLDLTVTDGDGNETIGRDTTNYTTFVNNYNQNVISGLTGSIMGPTSFSANWSGNSPDTTINYNDNMTYDDAGLGNFFQRVFSVGNGYFTTLLLSVLAVAFAAYIIYGRS